MTSDNGMTNILPEAYMQKSWQARYACDLEAHAQTSTWLINDPLNVKTAAPNPTKN